MKLFRFCRWSLAALPVFLVFMACDHWTGFPTEAEKGSGVKIPMKISAVQIAGSSQNETITRAGGEKRMVQEPVTQAFGGASTEISVEEDVSALRDDKPQRLGGGVKFRIIALKSGKLFDYADYTMPESEPDGGALTPDEGSDELECEVGETYDFICVSYNSKTDLPDDTDYEEDEALPSLTVDNSKDLLYWNDLENTIAANEVLSINMKQQLAKVKLKLDWKSAYNTGWYISEVSNAGVISVKSAATANFNLADGTFSSISGDAVFTGWTSSGAGTGTVWESTLRIIPGAAAPTFSFSREVMKVSTNGLSINPYSIPTPPVGTSQTLALKTVLQKEKSYTVRLTSRLSKFASSNIYWDGSKLTFKPYSDTPGSAYTAEQQYIGVHFRFGSLVGVAPTYRPDHVDAFGAENTPIYVPSYNSTTPSATAWSKTTTDPQFGTTTGNSSTDWQTFIPYLAANPNPTGNPDDRSAIDYPETNWATEYKGDICRLISKSQNLGDYRLPTASEFGLGMGGAFQNWNTTGALAGWTVENGTNTNWDWFYPDNTKDMDNFGLYNIDNGAWFGPTNNFFPAAGTRGSFLAGTGNLGTIGNIGLRGAYWSGSANSSSLGGYLLRIDKEYMKTDYAHGNFVQTAQAVRCVLDD